MNEQSRNTFGTVLLGVVIALLVVVLLILAYFVYNNSVNSADQYGTDFYHRFEYCQSVKASGKSYLNVKWPPITDSSWRFGSMEFNGEQYIFGTCKVTAEGNPEKIDVISVFQLHGRDVSTAFFLAGDKIYYDGIDLTEELLNQVLGKDTSIHWQVTSTTGRTIE